MATADDFYRWRGEIEQISEELLIPDDVLEEDPELADLVAGLKQRPDKISDEMFERYCDALRDQARRADAPHGIAKGGGGSGANTQG
jgi:hypothetical protein